MVKPDKVDDDASVILAHDVAKRIEEDMEYPGQIKSGHRSRDPGRRLRQITKKRSLHPLWMRAFLCLVFSL